MDRTPLNLRLQRRDADFAALIELREEFSSAEKRSPQQRAAAHCQNPCLLRFAVPNNDSGMNGDNNLAVVGQNSGKVIRKRQAERGNDSKRQRQGSCIARIHDKFDGHIGTLRQTKRDGQQGVQVFDAPGQRVSVRSRMPPKVSAAL